MVLPFASSRCRESPNVAHLTGCPVLRPKQRRLIGGNPWAFSSAWATLSDSIKGPRLPSRCSNSSSADGTPASGALMAPDTTAARIVAADPPGRAAQRVGGRSGDTGRAAAAPTCPSPPPSPALTRRPTTLSRRHSSAVERQCCRTTRVRVSLQRGQHVAAIEGLFRCEPGLRYRPSKRRTAPSTTIGAVTA